VVDPKDHGNKINYKPVIKPATSMPSEKEVEIKHLDFEKELHSGKYQDSCMIDTAQFHTIKKNIDKYYPTEVDYNVRLPLFTHTNKIPPSIKHGLNEQWRLFAEATKMKY